MDFECTDEEYSVLTNMVQEELNDDFAYYLALVLLGLKPAISPPSSFKVKEIEEITKKLEAMGLKTKRFKLDFIESSDIPDFAKERAILPFVVTKNSERFDMLDDKYSHKFSYYRDFGIFLGYPREDVEWYVDEARNGNYDHYNRSRRQLGSPDDFDKTVSSVFYIPKPTEERYNAARERAERYLRGLRKADEKFQTEIGEMMIRNHIE